MKIRGRGLSVIAVCTFVAVALLFIFSRGTDKHRSGISAAAPASPISKDGLQKIAAYGNLPISFEENKGQSAGDVRYLSRGNGYELLLTSQEAVLSLHDTKHRSLSPRNRFATLKAMREKHNALLRSRIRVQLEGANPNTQIAGLEQLPGKVNYFIGNDPKNWRTDVATYSRVKYTGVYPGVDLVFYGNQQHLEYDFVLAPGADLKNVAFKIEGARNLKLSSRGDLVLGVNGGQVELQKPVIYQQIEGARREVAGTYVVNAKNRITFSVPNYDRNEPLILDPVLNYSTYIGGASDDEGTSIAVDSTGNAYIAGTTFSTNFPTTTDASGVLPGPTSNNDGGAAFVTKLNPAGTTVLYSTYLSGSVPGETAFGVAIDSSGMIYVTGQTFSSDFPTIGGLKTGTNAGAAVGTSYLAKLNPALTGTASLVYSTYLGGTNGTGPIGDVGVSVAADPTTVGTAYVTGYTDSTAGTGSNLQTFPVLNGFQTTLSNTNGNAFLMRIDTTATGTNSLVYSTYLGGNGANFDAANDGFADAGFGVTADAAHKAYVVGTTSSTDLAVKNALQPTSPAGNTIYSVFVAAIDTTATSTTSLSYLTYLGGSSYEFGDSIALGPNNIAYVSGITTSLNFPTTTGSFSNTGSSTFGTAFLSLIDTTKTTAGLPEYSTFLGGTGGDEGFSLAVDADGDAYIGGKTSSSDFPAPAAKGGLQATFPAGAAGVGFVAKIHPASAGASDLIYSTFFGGTGNGSSDIDEIEGIAVDASKNVYITGQTISTNLLIAGTPVAPLTAGLNGPSDAFVAKLTLVPTFAVTPTSLDFGTQLIGAASAPQSLTVTNNNSSAITVTSIAVVAGTPPASGTDFAKSADTCGTSVAAGATCTVSVTFTPAAAGAEAATLVFTTSDSSSPLAIPLTGTGANFTVSPALLPFGDQTVNTQSAAQVVTISNGTGATVNLTSAVSSNPAVFAATTTCGATIPTGNTCTVSVIFTPTVTGAATGTLTITDGDPSSPQVVQMTGNGTAASADFTIAATTPAAVAQGGSTTFTITMTPQNGFNSAVALTCTGAPAESTCTINPTSVSAADGTTAQTATATVTTTAPHATTLFVPSVSHRTPPTTYILRIVPLFLAFLMFLVFRSTQGLKARLVTISAMFLFIGIAGCSSSSNNGGGGGTTGGTPKGNATLTVTGTSGSLTHTATVTLTVN